MNSSDDIKHVKGESVFVDDIPTPSGTLFSTVFCSSIAHGKIVNLDFREALKVPGFVKIITYKDIPGENQIGNIIADESLLAEDKVEYIGEPIALILADSKLTANNARDKIKIEYEKLAPITDPREAFKAGSLISAPKIFEMGDTEKAFANSEYVFNDRVEIGGQEHLYLETQGTLAIPSEGNSIKIFSSTQSPTVVQKAISKVLNLNMHQVEVDVLRLGGAFGGKEDQATPWAAMCALGAFLTKRPVKLILNRHEDLYMTGKRHPYSVDYKIGFSKDFTITAYKVDYYQNAGACADLSTAVLERTLFHATNSYYIPNVKATGFSCKTNLPPNTAFRGFGGPQAMFVIESAIHKAANELKIPASIIQEKNLIKEGEKFYYGQTIKENKAVRCWKEAKSKFNFTNKQNEINQYNSINTLSKKGISLMPVCFGISFTSSFLNQASALIHIYTDASISISTAAVEMGQGVNEKMINIVSEVFSIEKSKIRVESTNTTRVANTSPTAASSAADLNGNAVLIASKILKDRLIHFICDSNNLSEGSKINFKNGIIYLNEKDKLTSWNELILSAYLNRISLSSQAYYATPDIYFDRKINQGNPFAYYVCGTAITTVKVDCLRGIYEIEAVDVVHDFGKSINAQIDLGQAEGAIVQGIGWMTLEELVQNAEGELKSNSLSTYKIPDIYTAPKSIKVEFLDDSDNPYGPFNSKAIGEPPFMYGIGAYFALANAISEFNPKLKLNYSSPLTNEKCLMMLYQNYEDNELEIISQDKESY